MEKVSKRSEKVARLFQTVLDFRSGEHDKTPVACQGFPSPRDCKSIEKKLESGCPKHQAGSSYSWKFVWRAFPDIPGSEDDMLPRSGYFQAWTMDLHQTLQVSLARIHYTRDPVTHTSLDQLPIFTFQYTRSVSVVLSSQITGSFHNQTTTFTHSLSCSRFINSHAFTTTPSHYSRTNVKHLHSLR